jgi:O-succinylbenzoic acid--CoA ligase
MRVRSATFTRVDLGSGHIRAAWGEISERQVVHLTVVDETGEAAVGEAAPIAGYTGESLEQTCASLDQLIRADGPLFAMPMEGPDDISGLLESVPLTASAAHALDQALLTLLARRTKRSMASLLSPSPRSAVASHALVHDLAGARQAVGRGVTALKLKLGLRPWDQERAWLETLRHELGPDIGIRVDLNCAWTLEEATDAWPELHALDVELVEDPLDVQDVAGYGALREMRGPRVAIDQGCRNAEELQRWITARAVDIVVLKPMVIGGLQRARDMAMTAAQAGLGVMVTTCLESELGRQGALAVARAVPAGSLEVCGLDPIASVWPGGEVLRGPLPNPVASSAISEPNRIALVMASTSRSWRELAEAASKVASALANQGVEPGHVVAIEGRPSVRWVEAFFGITWLGAIAAPIASASDPQTLSDVSVDYVLSDGPEAVARGPWRSMSLQADWSDQPRHPEHDWQLERPLVRLLTSGTAGRANVVTLSTAQIVFGALGSTIRLGHDGKDRWLCCLPLHHIGGLSILCRAALSQTSVELHEGFESRRVERALSSGSIQLVSLVPEMLRRLLSETPRPSWPGVRAALIGGAACDGELNERAMDAGVPVALTWGMTETAAQVATTRPSASSALGLPPLPFARVSVDEMGQLRVSGPQAGGTPLVSGDGGRVQDGAVVVTGRVDGVINSGALRVDPEVTRRALLSHPAVEEAHVVARPSERWGHRPVAALVPADQPVATEVLRDALSGLLERPQMPDAWVWVSELPRGPMGKISGARILEMIEETQAGEPLTHLVGNRHGLEPLHVDEGMDLSNSRSRDAILGSNDLEGEGQAASSHGLNLHGDAQTLAQTHGPLEVGVGVNQGHAPAEIIEDRRPRRIDGQEQLLEGHMSVLEDSTIEGNASAIDLMEANADLVGESHKADSARQSETPGVADASSLEGTR